MTACIFVKMCIDAAKSGSDGVEIKATRKTGGAVDMHGARDQWLCVFVYSVDAETEPAVNRRKRQNSPIW